MVVLIVVGIAGLSVGRLRRLDRRLRAAALLAQGARPRLATPRCSPPTARAWASSRPTSCSRPVTRRRHARRCSRTPRSRSRTSASTSTRASTTRASSAPRSRTSLSRKTVQGGSTLTMQLVRNLYTRTRTREGLDGYQRKIREAKLAEELENEHSKEWILDKYLNTDRRTARSAARRRSAPRRPRGSTSTSASSDLDAARGRAAGRPAAGAVGTTRRSAQPERPSARRNEVLGKMAELGMITHAAGADGDEGAGSASTCPTTSAAAARATSSTTSRTS